mmetsp:Transcript_74534/g.241962  ORF Transcript_74534/g.241962 Transcript_74534/m.241962 type:complete len:172 (-) Transcript_74534:54-569(-)
MCYCCVSHADSRRRIAMPLRTNGVLVLALCALLAVASAADAAAADDATCSNGGDCSDGNPDSYLAETLEPQGLHKLWTSGVDIGSPHVSTKAFPAGDTLATGLWECTPGSWSITRTTTESFLVLRGRATLTNADGGWRIELAPGIWHVTPTGWSGRWEVTETIRKHFVLTP